MLVQHQFVVGELAMSAETPVIPRAISDFLLGIDVKKGTFLVAAQTLNGMKQV